jgi:hypothetical protein
MQILHVAFFFKKGLNEKISQKTNRDAERKTT